MPRMQVEVVINVRCRVDADDDTAGVDGGSPAKRVKGKGKAIIQKSKNRPTKDDVKPATHKVWADIPDWKGRMDSPFMNLPLEVLDQIFCIRPELAMGDYLALAGSSRFFRDQLNDDFWKAVLFAKDPDHVKFLPIPPGPDAAISPFNRTITNWYSPRSKHLLSPTYYPVVTTERKVSKWETKPHIQGYGVKPSRYHSGHYVPPGKRSGWTKAQYEIYKEDQASWRKDRYWQRLEGLAEKLEEVVEEEEGIVILREMRIRNPNGRGLCTSGQLLETINGIEYLAAYEPVKEAEGSSLLASSSVASLARESDHRSMSLPKQDDNEILGGNGILLEDRDSGAPNATLVNDPWEVPGSETSESEDEVEWLKERGAKLVHDHWPSSSRTKVARLVMERIYHKMSAAIKHFGMDQWELSTLKSYKTEIIRNDLKAEERVYCAHAVEARAFKFRGGPEAQERYVAALAERDQAERQREVEERQQYGRLHMELQ